MKPPNYHWICHRCESCNSPHTETCAHCGFQAIASTKEINPLFEEDKNKHLKPANFDFFLFMPEALAAIAIAIYSPIWSLKLIFSGHYSAACSLITVTIASGAGFIWAIKHKAKIIAYFAMMGFVAAAIGLDTWIVQ